MVWYRCKTELCYHDMNLDGPECWQQRKVGRGLCRSCLGALNSCGERRYYRWLRHEKAEQINAMDEASQDPVY